MRVTGACKSSLGKVLCSRTEADAGSAKLGLALVASESRSEAQVFGGSEQAFDLTAHAGDVMAVMSSDAAATRAASLALTGELKQTQLLLAQTIITRQVLNDSNVKVGRGP